MYNDSSLLYTLCSGGELQRLEWLLNGAEYLNGSESFSHLNLQIVNFTLSHAGEYSCRAVFIDGSTAGPVSAGFIEVLGKYAV